jgi:vacuolar-type H+-ATPase subunit E/Vma4
MEINQAQLNAIAHALTLAQYFVNEHEHSTQQWLDDMDTMNQAYIAMTQIQAQLEVTA